MNIIDFRSDTVTIPTPAMREAMYHAEVGDDVYGTDPTMNRLQAFMAELTGKEASLFVPSGTFGNQLALFTHCRRGDEVILAEDCHIVAHEVGAAAVIAGVQLITLPSIHGMMDLATVEKKIRKVADVHYPDTGLICLENAYSDGGVISLEYLQALRALANQYGVKVHLDGARVFNAATALDVDVKEILQYVDSASICLSKGLCAPIGSMLVGSTEFIEHALKKRKLMGGGMRQVGMLAAAGYLALTKMRLRLHEDHDHAKYLAKRLSEIPGIFVKIDCLDINLVFFEVNDATLLAKMTPAYFAEAGILLNPDEDGLFRLVTHYYIDKDAIDTFIEQLQALL